MSSRKSSRKKISSRKSRKRIIKVGSRSGKSRLRLLSIKKATNGKHKLVAKFSDGKEVKFGAIGYSDYTIHKDPERKQRYIIRHKKREDWNNPQTPGALSLWILWNKPTLKASISDFKKRFNL